MTARNIVLWMLTAGLAIFAFSCSDDDRTSNPGGWEPPLVTNIGPNGDTISGVTEGIYARLVIGRSMTYMGVGEPFKIDACEAIFDSAYGTGDPIRPIEGVGVSCNDSVLIWNKYAGRYAYPEIPIPMSPIIAPGAVYTFEIAAGSGVPVFTRSITFPSSEPYITYPTIMTTLDRSGFNINWAGSGSGVVELTFMDADGQIVFFEETPNDGSYAISSGVLSGLPSGECVILMSHQNLETFTAAGYDSRSYIAARVQSQTMFTLK